MLHPLLFQPVFMERVWGGRNLERLYQKPLPAGKVIGESWEISDRPEAVSVIANGPLAGKTLRWLMEEHRRDVLGTAADAAGRFPLLVKILDAQETLSVQVHPPARVAAELGGEPKTEMWFITDATPEAALYAGLKQGVTRAQFERKIADGTVAECLPRLPVTPSFNSESSTNVFATMSDVKGGQIITSAAFLKSFSLTFNSLMSSAVS